jgi:hypothetical protein
MHEKNKEESTQYCAKNNEKYHFGREKQKEHENGRGKLSKKVRHTVHKMGLILHSIELITKMKCLWPISLCSSLYTDIL